MFELVSVACVESFFSQMIHLNIVAKVGNGAKCNGEGGLRGHSQLVFELESVANVELFELVSVACVESFLEIGGYRGVHPFRLRVKSPVQRALVL